MRSVQPQEMEKRPSGARNKSQEIAQYETSNPYSRKKSKIANEPSGTTKKNLKTQDRAAYNAKKFQNGGRAHRTTARNPKRLRTQGVSGCQGFCVRGGLIKRRRWAS